ncbi:polysaccharide pyruvyl transferase family protein [Isoptericola sp. b408]|uniref:polysaccharide pyruvyl transferase family protein n=1 Tax=Isoptericola sp. b408 TaxID=3064653 RepID=UPI0027141913|nr:polysaccharide pyruvyl transferase family protein [Isoptericola sp. b408]MDO8152699.1 polysaccharide pyruvyl transferase family protein [Isoptericola sp. b408]
MSPLRLWWWRWRYPTELNFGDELTTPLLERLTGRPVEWSPLEQADVVGAGSVLQTVLRSRPDRMPKIWGTGMIAPLQDAAPPSFRPLAVRGRLSLEQLSPESRAATALGDPGILADRLVDGPVRKRYALGVVPHYKDAGDSTMRALTDLGPSVRRIDVAWSPEEVAREIASCEVVVSSSMHGLIFADSLEVPNVRLKVSNKLVGGDFKFRDYCSAFGPDRYQDPVRPDDVRDRSLTQVVDLVRDRFRPPSGIDRLKEGLVAALPV